VGPEELEIIDTFLSNRLKTESVPLIRLPETTRNVYKHKRTKENEQLQSSSLFGDSKDFSTKDQTNIKAVAITRLSFDQSIHANGNASIVHSNIDN